MIFTFYDHIDITLMAYKTQPSRFFPLSFSLPLSFRKTKDPWIIFNDNIEEFEFSTEASALYYCAPYLTASLLILSQLYPLSTRDSLLSLSYQL